MKIRYLIFTSFILILSGCNETYLEKVPKDQLTELTTFTTNSNFITYSWSFYDAFTAYDSFDALESEFKADLGLNSDGTLDSDWLWKRVIIPSSSAYWDIPYKNIRHVNLMLSNIPNSKLTNAEKDHWTSVAFFFRSYEYVKLLKAYGDVPWVDHLLPESDQTILYGPRTPRDDVAQNILNDLKWAELHINANGNGANTINPSVVRALISRFGLFEGTWRKYHGLSNAQQYLQACADASAQLVIDFPDLHPKYDEDFNSESLAAIKGIILYKQYELGQLMHKFSHWNRSSSGIWDITKKGVDLYLCLDGQSRWTSPMFMGDTDPYTEFRNRDRRLYFVTPPPFRVTASGITYTLMADPKYSEYINLMKTLSDDKHKTLPLLQWAGTVVKTSPHFRKYNEGQGFNVTYTGYQNYKYYNKISMTSLQDINDFPIFRMGEILVNYAEAMYELAKFDQTIADKTINKLRARGGVAALNIANIVPDPTRDTDINPVLWEIRRERAVELMGEGYRYDDVRRWKKFQQYGGAEKLGRWVKNSDYGNSLPIQGGASAGYVSPYGVPPGVPDYYDLLPIPSDQIVLNPNLKQNPGWQ